MNSHAKYLMVLVFVVVFGFQRSLMAETPTAIDLTSLSIEELMEIEIRPTATLTQTSTRNRPAAVTIISRQEIENSGARSLDELLNIRRKPTPLPPRPGTQTEANPARRLLQVTAALLPLSQSTQQTARSPHRKHRVSAYRRSMLTLLGLTVEKAKIGEKNFYAFCVRPIWIFA